MIPRTLAAPLRQAARQFPVVTLTGPRQSGKTTLVRHVFPRYEYVSLELPDLRRLALEDPRGFLAQFRKPVILDEVQRAPELFSYLQVLVDEHPDRTGRFILTGSQNFLLLESISQTLAGRCAVLHLLPLSLAELQGRAPLSLGTLGRRVPPRRKPPPKDMLQTLFAGFFPRIHDRKLPPPVWLASYYQTYLERDVRQVLNVGDLESFGRFVRLCAGRCGQLLNLSSLASDCGVAHTTARRWLSVLEASFVIVLLRPYHRNFGKRLVKSPKLYFLDPGLLCFLLQIRSPEELFQRAERGAVFESFVLAELFKNFLHRGQQPTIFYWRDSTGHEIDFLLDLGSRLVAVETKSAQTITPEFFKNLDFWHRLPGQGSTASALIYGGPQALRRRNTVIYPWFSL